MMSPMPCINMEELRTVDIRTVDPSTLIDIRTVEIKTDLPFDQKALDYLKQIGNPYCFRCGDVTVKIKYSENETTLNDCMEGFFRTI